MARCREIWGGVLDVIKVIDAWIPPDVQVRPDGVAHVLGLEVDDHIVHLASGEVR